MTGFALTRRDRLASLLLALAVQACFIALLIFSHSAPVLPQRVSAELTFILPRLPQTMPAPAKPALAPSSGQAVPLPIAPPFPPLSNASPIPLGPSPEQLRALGQSIFGCAPQTYSSLPPEQRARCPRPGDGFAIRDEPNLMGTPDHVRDEAHWENELAHEKSPVWLPCFGAGYAPSEAAVGADIKCLVEAAAHGQLTDPRQWPIYETQRLAPNELYKVEQAYQVWNQAHGKKQPSAATAAAGGTGQ